MNRIPYSSRYLFFFVFLFGVVIVVNLVWGSSYIPGDTPQNLYQNHNFEELDTNKELELQNIPDIGRKEEHGEKDGEDDWGDGGDGVVARELLKKMEGLEKEMVMEKELFKKMEGLEKEREKEREMMEEVMRNQEDLWQRDKKIEETLEDQAKMIHLIKEKIIHLVDQETQHPSPSPLKVLPSPRMIPPPPPIPLKTPPINPPLGNGRLLLKKSSGKRFLGLITGFGPNNQYLGTKESMFIAKLLNRTFVCSHFFLHDNVYLTVDSIRTFESTFRIAPVKSYLPAIPMGEFVSKCNGKIDTIVWMRDQTDEWKRRVGLLLDYLNVKVVREIKAPPAGNYHPVMRSIEEVYSYFSEIYDDSCVLLAFPFRNLGFEINSDVYNLIPKYLIHSDYIREKAWEAIREMGIQRIDKENANFISLHWRYGELTCKVEPPIVHEGYDFCWGTSIFYWSTMDDIYEAMKPLFEKFPNPVLFIATDIKEHEEMFRKFLSFLSRIPRLRIYRASQLSCLASITDNYYLSLVEQEICSISKVFIRSTGSTWSDFVSDFVKCVDFKPIKATSFNILLDAQKLPWTERNCFSDKRPIPRNGAIIKNLDVDPPYANWFC